MATCKDNRTSVENPELSQSNTRKVYVGNISFEVRIAKLKTFFSTFGKVIKVQLLFDRKQRKSRGCAFVTFSTTEEAERAKTSSEEDRQLDGRVMIVTALQKMPRKKRKQLEQSTANNEVDFEEEELDCEDEGDVCSPNIVTEKDSQCFQDAKPSPIKYIPDHVLIQIFLHFDVRERTRIESVCRRWRHVAGLSWQSVKKLSFGGIFSGFNFGAANPEKSVLTDATLKSILRKGCRNLRSLDVSSSPKFLTVKSAEIIGRTCPELQHINLSGMRINNHGMQELSNQCVKLKKVELQRCHELGEKGFWWLFKHCPYLEYLDARENLGITGQCFHILNPSCHTVILEACNNIHDTGMQQITKKCGPGLRVFNINRCFRLTDAAINGITEECPYIQKFFMCGDYPSITDGSLVFLGTLSQLEELHLAHNQAVSDDVISRISTGCRNLRVLNILGCNENVTCAGVQCLSCCTKLDNLDISYIDKITDASILQIALNCKLQRLIMRSLPEVSNEGLRALAEHCTTLQTLDISACEFINDEVIQFFIFSRQYQRQEQEDSIPTLHITSGGTQITEDMSTIAACSDAGVEVVLHDLSVPQTRDHLESFDKFFLSDDEDGDDWDLAPSEAVVYREPADHSYHLRDLAVENMHEWNDQRQLHYGAANVLNQTEPDTNNGTDELYESENWDEPGGGGAQAFCLPVELVNDFLDADDPSAWDEDGLYFS